MGRKKSTQPIGTRKRLRLYYCAYLHGSERCFRKFVRAGRFYNVDVLIFGGDVSGKILVPIVRRPGGGWDCTLLEKPYRLESAEELRAIEERIRFNGFYPYHCSTADLEDLSVDPDRVRA